MLHRLLGVVRQPLHMFLMEQAAYFRSMRKHVVPPFVFSACRWRFGVWGSASKRALSFRNGSCFRTPITAPMVWTSDLSK
jgi:hypothetical protein